MRIQDKIYFSEKLQLRQLKISNKELVLTHFAERIENYYFEPIRMLNQQRNAFASGAILCLLIDAFSRYATRTNKVGTRYVKWCRRNLDVKREIATNFYECFRCGLLHESHIKKFGQFSFDKEFSTPISEEEDYIVVQPTLLYETLKKYFDSFMEKLKTNKQTYNVFIKRIECDFKEEVERARISFRIGNAAREVVNSITPPANI